LKLLNQEESLAKQVISDWNCIYSRTL